MRFLELFDIKESLKKSNILLPKINAKIQKIIYLKENHTIIVKAVFTF